MIHLSWTRDLPTATGLYLLYEPLPDTIRLSDDYSTVRVTVVGEGDFTFATTVDHREEYDTEAYGTEAVAKRSWWLGPLPEPEVSDG